MGLSCNFVLGRSEEALPGLHIMTQWQEMAYDHWADVQECDSLCASKAVVSRRWRRHNNHAASLQPA